MLPDSLQSLISQFTSLPGIGPRQAARFVFFLLRNKKDAARLKESLEFISSNVALCEQCFMPALRNFSEEKPSQLTICNICSGHRRDKNIICVVEKETDAVNFEKTGHFSGIYYVLGGYVNPLEESDTPRERVRILTERLKNTNSGIELILSLSPRREGDFTSAYIEKNIKESFGENCGKIKITRLGRGLSSGAELEYADEETLLNAFIGRK